MLNNGVVKGVILDSGEKIQSNKVISSMGLPETMNIVSEEQESPAIGAMSFTETILFFDKKPCDEGIKETIIFYNDHDKYDYKRPQNLCDYRSAVICLPNNFDDDDYDEGVIRVTFIANFEKWNELDRKTYLLKKKEVCDEAMALIAKVFPEFQANCFIMMFLHPRPLRVTQVISKVLCTEALKKPETAEPVLKTFLSAVPIRVF